MLAAASSSLLVHLVGLISGPPDPRAGGALFCCERCMPFVGLSKAFTPANQQKLMLASGLTLGLALALFGAYNGVESRDANEEVRQKNTITRLARVRRNRQGLSYSLRRAHRRLHFTQRYRAVLTFSPLTCSFPAIGQYSLTCDSMRRPQWGSISSSEPVE